MKTFDYKCWRGCLWAALIFVTFFGAREGWAALDEPLRPLYHFTAPQGWIGDPNGMVWHNGEYHFFYQYNPDEVIWVGHKMHWGHAVSRDLVHWEHLPIALYPDARGAIWSGSAVIDHNNTAGFGAGAMVAIYTTAGNPFTQDLAYSLDNGRTWTKYAGNPVLPNFRGDNRDPQVFWYEPGNKWVMSLWLEGNDFALFSSPNLKEWTYMSTFVVPGVIEVPSLFEIPVDGNPGNTRWIFYSGAGVYYVGRFDGTQFIPQGGPYGLNAGNSYTAAQLFNNEPGGRHILIAQGVTDYPGMPFDNYMNFPVELSLRSDEGPLFLHANPVPEIELLRLNTNSWEAQPLVPGENPMAGTVGEAFELDAVFAPGNSTQVGFILRGTLVLFDNQRGDVICQGLRRGIARINGRVRLRILVDRGVITIFGNEGRLYMPMVADTAPGAMPVGMFAGGSGASLVSLKMHDLKRIWE